MLSNENKEIWIFLSHSNKDFAKVRLIRNYLEEHSCRPLMFYLRCLSNEDEINDLIKREIDCRTRFIICDSENSRSSKWVKSEVDYIKSKYRTYETIDLSERDEIIKGKLDSYIRKSKIFFCYAGRDSKLVEEVYFHISKYDIRCYCHADFLGVGAPAPLVIQLALNSIKEDCGFVVFFASKSSLKSKYCEKEIRWAEAYGINIFILLLDEYAKNNIRKYFPHIVEKVQRGGLPLDDSFLTGDISGAVSFEYKVESAIEEIVNRIFPFWDTYTMAKNFLEGVDCQKDEKEASRLFGIVYRKAYYLNYVEDYPGGTLFLARCLANGYGTEKNISKALRLYQRCVHGFGIVGLDKEIEDARRELQESDNRIIDSIEQ